MPQTPHVERHFTGPVTVRDLVIGMSDGLTVPFALAIFGYVKGHFTGAQLSANGTDWRIGRRGGILDRQSDLMSRVRRNIITSSLSGLAASSDPTRPPDPSAEGFGPQAEASGVRAGSGP